MKEVKLRAWYRGKMYYFVEHHSFPDGSSGVNCIGEDIEHMFSPGDEVEPIQFTGLKDKNGKDIFEGDIIQHPPFWEDGHTMTLVKNIHEFCGDYGIYGNFETEIEVIGNIFENPELVNC